MRGARKEKERTRDGEKNKEEGDIDKRRREMERKKRWKDVKQQREKLDRKKESENRKRGKGPARERGEGSKGGKKQECRDRTMAKLEGNNLFRVVKGSGMLPGKAL